MIYRTIWVGICSLKWLKTVWNVCLHQHIVLALYPLGRNWKLLKVLRILIAVVYFKVRNWISKTMYCISCSMVCKIVFCTEFPDIPDKTGRKTTRRRTQAIANRYAFHANAIKRYINIHKLLQPSTLYLKHPGGGVYGFLNLMIYTPCKVEAFTRNVQ